MDDGGGGGVGGPCPLEIAFSFNVAGAYGPMPPSSKSYLKGLIQSLHDDQLLQKILTINSPSSRTRVAIFAHGLHKKTTEGIQSLELTDDVKALRHFVAMTSPRPWGAREHCYELVLRKARALAWTPGSKRALVLVGCTRPHDGNHVGCVERVHWRVEARCLAQKGITVYPVEVRLGDDASDFYRELAEITEGCHVTLEQCTPMEDVITAIVSHLVSAEKMEEFEQEVVDRADDGYSYDMARLFATLRHHDDLMTTTTTSSRPDTPTPGTPQASDFEDVDDDEDDASREVTSSVPEVTQQETSSSSSSSLSSSRAREQPSVQKPVSTVRLRRSKTAPVSLRIKQERKEESAAVDTAVFSVPSERKSGKVESSRKRPGLRRGVTSGCLDGGGGTGGAGGGGGRGVAWGRRGSVRNGNAEATDVYKIDREAPTKRENISPRTFTLRHLSWTPWKLVISPALPSSSAGKPDDWEPRCDQSQQHVGYRRKTITQNNNNNNNNNVSAALYELALKTDESPRKRVVFYKFLSKLAASSSWEDQLLSRSDLRVKVSEAVGKKCGVFLRLAPLAVTGGGRAQTVVQAALHKYDYAWNDVQGLGRSVRQVEFF